MTFRTGCACTIVASIAFLSSATASDEPVGWQFQDCPRDSVRAGTVCMDKYEASVWRTTNKRLIRKIRSGTVTLAELRNGGAVQVQFDDPENPVVDCPYNGAGCKDLYAVSLRAVQPSNYLSWFQATAVARNSWKRLPSNAEWQVAVLGTPDVPDDGALECNTGDSPGPTLTGTRSRCVSDVGAFDMVGNVMELVSDWVPLSTTCGDWIDFSDDLQCFAGAAVSGPPGALMRGGFAGDNASAGPLSIRGNTHVVTASGGPIGFRAAR
jgi:formylglycine-generating enzyme required for sulfatase activity